MLDGGIGPTLLSLSEVGQRTVVASRGLSHPQLHIPQSTTTTSRCPRASGRMQIGGGACGQSATGSANDAVLGCGQPIAKLPVSGLDIPACWQPVVAGPSGQPHATVEHSYSSKKVSGLSCGPSLVKATWGMATVATGAVARIPACWIRSWSTCQSTAWASIRTLKETYYAKFTFTWCLNINVCQQCVYTTTLQWSKSTYSFFFLIPHKL